MLIFSQKTDFVFTGICRLKVDYGNMSSMNAFVISLWLNSFLNQFGGKKQQLFRLI